MGFDAIGKIVSSLLLMGSGLALASGATFYRREKQTGISRNQLLIYSCAAALWAFCFGTIGICNSISTARIFRVFGILGIDVFLAIDFVIVTELSRLSVIQKRVMKFLIILAYIVDFIMFSDANHDAYEYVGKYLSWTAVDTIGRRYHTILIAICFVVSCLLGISAYYGYRYHRQKRFLVTFAIANLFLAASSLFDTLLVLGYALPTSGLGAIFCTVVLLTGALKDGAFDTSISGLANKIFDTMTCGIIILDGDKEIKFSNRFSDRLLGSRCTGKQLSDIFDIKGEELNRLFDESSNKELKTVHLQLQGSMIKCSCQLSSVIDHYGDPQCYIFSFADVTNELNMLEELKEVNAVKSNFLSSMSHEIRTPINSVIGMNEMIRRECQDEKLLSYAGNIDRSSHQLLAIINDILDYSNIESGNLQLYVVSYDVSSMINDMYHIVSQKAKEKGLDFTLHANPMIPSWLVGDEVRISQIMMNLLSNSVKFTDEGFVSCDIDFESVDDSQINLIISVRDSGRGIENADGADLFGTFSKIDQIHNKSIAGTGLGLAITKSLLVLMDGDVRVESIFGVGSRFTVTIPQRVDNRSPIGKIEERLANLYNLESQYSESFVAPDATILVVDDVEMNLIVVEELLKQTQIKIDRAVSGYDALRRCRDTKYDVILMDHMMPGMDGVECLRRLREVDGPNQNSPVIALTANAIIGMRDKYLGEGFNDYLTKPIDGSKLEASLKSFLFPA